MEMLDGREDIKDIDFSAIQSRIDQKNIDACIKIMDHYKVILNFSLRQARDARMELENKYEALHVEYEDLDEEHERLQREHENLQQEHERLQQDMDNYNAKKLLEQYMNEVVGKKLVDKREIYDGNEEPNPKRPTWFYVGKLLEWMLAYTEGKTDEMKSEVRSLQAKLNAANTACDEKLAKAAANCKRANRGCESKLEEAKAMEAVLMENNSKLERAKEACKKEVAALKTQLATQRQVTHNRAGRRTRR